MTRRHQRPETLVGSIALLGGLLLATAGQSAERAPASQGKAIDPYLKKAGAEWDSLFNAHYAVRLAALYSEDVISMPFSAPTIHGRQALQADFEKFFSQNTGRHETLVDEILAAEDWAIERAHYTLVYKPKSGGPEVAETGRHVVCRKRLGGGWQIAWELWNTDTPAAQ